MKHVLLFILMANIYIATYSQENYSFEYGKITQFEANMTEFPTDEDAEAAVIYEVGNNFFRLEDSGFVLYMEKTAKIKILKQAGEKYATIEIPYYYDAREGEKVVEIEATTYNFEDGQLTKTKLDPKNIFEEKLEKDYLVKKIALPNVKVGSIIEYKYTIITPYFRSMRPWYFQRTIPVVHSKLDYRAIPYYEYTFILKGFRGFDKQDSQVLSNSIHVRSLEYKEKKYTFEMNNVEAFRDEEFISSAKEYMSSLFFQVSKVYYTSGGSSTIISTWPEMIKDLLKNPDFGKFINNSEKEGKKILPTLDLSETDQRKKAEAIINHVKETYNWNYIVSKYASKSVKDFIKQKTGNSAEINLYLIGLLKAAGIEAEPVVTSTRSHGIVRKSYPFMQFLDYVIAQVKIGDTVFYADATESLLKADELPERCINVSGLIVKDKTEEWVDILQYTPAQTTTEIHISPDLTNNTSHVDAKLISSGYNAYEFRSMYIRKKENLSKFFQDRHQIEIKDDLNLENLNDVEKDFIFSFKYDLPLEVGNDKIFINPFANIGQKDNPFKQKTRTFLIDLVSIKKDSYNVTIDIPDGYKVEYLPAEVNHSSALLEFTLHTTSDEKTINLNLNVNMKSNLYEAKDYQKLKATFDAIMKRYSDVIILIKK